MIYYQRSVFFFSTYILLSVYGDQDLFEQKCKRECNTEQGSLDCWKETTDGFTYGLSTAMIDYCQVIIQLRQMNTNSWYNISQDILIQTIENYDIDKRFRQLSKDDIKQVAIILLNKCFDSSSSSSSQPSCPSCSIKQIQLIAKWRITSIILTSICILFFFVILLLYIFHNHSTRRSYESIN